LGRNIALCSRSSRVAHQDMFISLICVSRSLVARAGQRAEIQHLVDALAARNASIGVRGALIVTERYFAQLLEGPEAAVDELVAAMRLDPRHDRFTVIERRPIDGYRFPDWSLAYWGDAGYMDQKIAAVLDRQDELRHPRELYELMWRLSQESRRQHRPIGRPSPD